MSQKQRFIAIYLMVRLFSADLNPFYQAFSMILDKSTHHFERRFLCEQLLDLNFDKWDKSTPNQLIKEAESYTEEYNVPDAINNLTTLFNKDLDKVQHELNRRTHISKLLQESPTDKRGDQPSTPDEDLLGDTLSNLDLDIEPYQPKFITPLPLELPIKDQEYKAIIPLVMEDTLWVQHEVEDGDYLESAIKETVGLAAKKNLSSDQITHCLQIFEEGLSLLEKSDLLLQNLEKVLDLNPSLVSGLIIILSKEKPQLFKRCLNKFVGFSPNINSLEVIFRTIQNVKVPQSFLNQYIYQWFEACKKLENDA